MIHGQEQNEHQAGDGASGNATRLAGLREALIAPLRWLVEQLVRGSRWLRRRLKFGISSIRDLFRRWSKDRGFGFWWLVVTLLLAGIVGLLVAALVAPVMGILACLVVLIWVLIRQMSGSSRDKTGSAATA